jgi:MFS family permease
MTGRRPIPRTIRREGGFTAIMTGATEPYMIPYALALGAGAFEAGLLSSGRNLLVALLQLWSAELAGWIGSRRRLVLATIAVQALLWLPIAFARPVFGAWAVAALIVCYTLGTAIAALGVPAWGSLMADYVPAEERGRFFGRRARDVGQCTTAATLLGGLALHGTARTPFVGFAVLCLVAAASRVVAWDQVRRIREEDGAAPGGRQFSFLEFLRAAPNSNFARFSLTLGSLGFATHMASPFFAVYLLQRRGLDYLTYSLVILTGSLVGSLGGAWWGRVGDRTGNHAVLRWATLGVAGLPLVWLAAPSAIALGAVNAVGAFLWSGINLAATNFLYDAVTPAKRHTCLAYFNVVNGVGIGLGALAGGLVLQAFPSPTEAAFATLFAASVVLRVAAALTLRRSVHEVRSVETIAFRQLVLDLVGQRLVAVLDALPGRRSRSEEATAAGDRPDRPPRGDRTEPPSRAH